MASTKLFDFKFPNPKPFPDLKLEGDTHYTDHSLRFTKTDDHDNPMQWSMGRAICKDPVVFKLGHKVANFETEVQFKVTPMKNKRYADGLAFFIVPAEGYDFPAAVGIFGRPGVFAVAFDIYSQNHPGYIKLGLCFSERTPKSFILFPADSFLETDLKLKVSYDSAIKLISASVSNDNMTFPVSYTYDLGDFLPSKVKVALGSSTGEYVALHDAYSLYYKFDALQATS